MAKYIITLEREDVEWRKDKVVFAFDSKEAAAKRVCAYFGFTPGMYFLMWPEDVEEECADIITKENDEEEQEQQQQRPKRRKAYYEVDYHKVDVDKAEHLEQLVRFYCWIDDDDPLPDCFPITLYDVEKGTMLWRCDPRDCT